MATKNAGAGEGCYWRLYARPSAPHWLLFQRRGGTEAKVAAGIDVIITSVFRSRTINDAEEGCR